MNRRDVLGGLAASAAPSLMARSALAESWPSRVVTLVVPYGAGGTTDAVARPLAERLSQALGQRVIVENRPGANSNVGSEFVVRAAPDGYTLLLAGSALGNNRAFGPKPKFDVGRDLRLIAQLGRSPNILVARPDLGIRSMSELVRLTQQKPNVVTVAGGQIDHHIELLKRRSGAQFRAIPYRTSTQAMTDAIAGHVDLAMSLVPTALSHLGEKLVPLAVSSRERTGALPAVPTYAEAGIEDAEVESWFGIAAPAGTPASIADRLAVEARAFVLDPATRIYMNALGMDVAPDGTPDTFAAFAAQDAARWLRLAQEFNVTAN